MLRSTVSIFLASLCLASVSVAQQLDFTPFHADGIYHAGEKVGWKITVHSGSALPSTDFSYVVRSNNLDVIGNGHFDLSSGAAAIETMLKEPGMVYVEVDSVQSGNPSRPEMPAAPAANRIAALGAAVDPSMLQPSVSAPADFWEFWNAQLKQLRTIPIDPILTPVPTQKEDVDLFAVKLASAGSTVQGYLSKPKRDGKFPALVIYQYAGVYKLQPNTVTRRAADGWLTFDVDSHDISPDSDEGVQRDYQTIGNNDREKSYFLKMYLRDTRAIDYIRSRPDWDGKTIVVMGTSMGGQQSLVTAGLNSDAITAVIVNEPSGADTNGNLHGHKAGYPNWPSNDPQATKTALYFDTVNFASHIKAPTLAAMGFIDTTAPPVGIWTAIDQIPGLKEVVPMVESDHNNITPQKQGAFNRRSEEVLTEILHGEQFKPDQTLSHPSR
ncbi:MAG TPA: acetylxylan esterase [Acidobacteriaceae bacterium]